MLVIPEAVRLKEEAACIDLQQAMLAHLGGYGPAALDPLLQFG